MRSKSVTTCDKCGSRNVSIYGIETTSRVGDSTLHLSPGYPIDLCDECLRGLLQSAGFAVVTRVQKPWHTAALFAVQVVVLLLIVLIERSCR